jgi:ubiquinone biosynthesis protein COQ4
MAKKSDYDLVTPVRPIEALRALRDFSRNPQDTTQVFRLTDALRGRSMIAPFERFRATAHGDMVLRERLPLLSALSNRATLLALPAGTFGRAYADFMAEEDLSAEGLVALSGAKESWTGAGASDMEFYGARMREMHDLYHVLAGYGRDELGEICVLAFSYQHVGTRSFKAIYGLGQVKLALAWRSRKVFAAIREAERHGRAAAWLPGENLEGMLGEDLAGLRRRFNILPPVVYPALIKELRERARAHTGPLSEALKNARRKVAAAE